MLTSLVPGQGSASVTWIVISLGLVRFLVGATHAPLFPVMNASIVRWFPPGGWALPLGLSSTGLTLGSAAAALAVPVSVAALGWRWTFILMAPAALFIGLVWWRYSRDNPAEHPGINEAELELIRAGRQSPEPRAEPEDRSDEGGSPDWLIVLKNRDALMLMLSYSFMNYVYYMIFTFGLIYLVDYLGMSSIQAGVVSAAQWSAGAAGAALGGLLCDALCRRFGLRWGLPMAGDHRHGCFRDPASIHGFPR